MKYVAVLAISTLFLGSSAFAESKKPVAPVPVKTEATTTNAPVTAESASPSSKPVDRETVLIELQTALEREETDTDSN